MQHGSDFIIGFVAYRFVPRPKLVPTRYFMRFRQMVFRVAFAAHQFQLPRHHSLFLESLVFAAVAAGLQILHPGKAMTDPSCNPPRTNNRLHNKAFQLGFISSDPKVYNG
jgi:hypothetical protein